MAKKNEGISARDCAKLGELVGKGLRAGLEAAQNEPDEKIIKATARLCEGLGEADKAQAGKPTQAGAGPEIEMKAQGAEKTVSAIEQFRKNIRDMKQAEEEEFERKLKRKANRIRKAMLQDLQARGLTAVPATERKNGAGARNGTGGGAGSGAWDSGRTGGGAAAGAGDRDRGAIYADMVEDYVALWITRERLEADIAERGVTVFDEKRGLPVENCSVSARVRVSKQMTTIMQTLGYKDQAIKARRPEGDADDEL